jgi:maleate isomerase
VIEPRDIAEMRELKPDIQVAYVDNAGHMIPGMTWTVSSPPLATSSTTPSSDGARDMTQLYRIGQIVPSSNTTMETEIPGDAQRTPGDPPRAVHLPFQPHAHEAGEEELAAMDAESDRCAVELSDAKVDVLGYACLVAIMAMGLGLHQSEKRLQQAADNDALAPVITSAGALVEALRVMKAKRIAIVAPYMKPLTELVVNYIREEGFEVQDWRALEIPDNLAVARHDQPAGHRRRHGP